MLCYEKRELYPLNPTRKKRLKHVDLLFLNRGKNSSYYWINFNRLLNDGQNGNQLFHCHFCLNGFTKKQLCKNHVPYCEVHDAWRTEMPTEEDNLLELCDVSKQLKVPYVIYADLKSSLERHCGCQPTLTNRHPLSHLSMCPQNLQSCRTFF